MMVEMIILIRSIKKRIECSIFKEPLVIILDSNLLREQYRLTIMYKNVSFLILNVCIKTRFSIGIVL